MKLLVTLHMSSSGVTVNGCVVCVCMGNVSDSVSAGGVGTVVLTLPNGFSCH